ncbi:MAG: polysaccharide biosynthesis protein, partial [Rubrobacter sp.]|nr:polysaccharide biosynthesis protein [Rubrobacter sp.]
AGETVIPRIPSARVTDIAKALIGDREIETTLTGIRPGEKVHEILISDEEAVRTVERPGTFRESYYAISSILPEVSRALIEEPTIEGEYSSRMETRDFEEVAELLKESGYIEKVGQPV